MLKTGKYIHVKYLYVHSIVLWEHTAYMGQNPKYSQFLLTLSASPVRGREGLAGLAMGLVSDSSPRDFWGRPQIPWVYGLCRSRKSRRIGRCATDVKNDNAGPKLHWRLWGKSGLSALSPDRDFSAKNYYPHGRLEVETKLFLAYCLYIRAILKEWQRKVCSAPIGCNAEVGPAFTFAICRENGDAMHELTGNSRPAYSV